MNVDDSDTLGTVEARAAYWLVRLCTPDVTPEDRYAFEAWKREEPENEAAFLKVQRGNAFIDRHIADPVLRQIGQQALDQTLSKRVSHRWVKFAAIAASVLVVGTVALLSSGTFSPTVQVAQIEAYETEVGERSIVTLSDGSIVTLNTNSRIEVYYTTLRREVKLLRGQGFFDVRKDVNRSFSVAAGGKRVVALGTAFDVRLDGVNAVEVTLVEGRVKVDDAVDPATLSGDATRVVNSVNLLPGERMIARLGTPPEIVEMNAVEATSWRNGRLVFRDEPIRSVIAEMNRYSAQQLKLGDDSRVNEIKVSGVFNTGRASSFVDTLTRMQPLNVQRSGENELTLVWQE